MKFFHKVDQNPALQPKEASPPRPKREPSPPHEYVLADNPDIAVRFAPLFVWLRVFDAKRRACADLRKKRGLEKLTFRVLVHRHVSLPIHRGISQKSAQLRPPGAGGRHRRYDPRHTRRALSLCAAGAAAEPQARRQVGTPHAKNTWTFANIVVNRPGHYNRALEEAIQSHKGQWAKDWESRNPLAGATTFGSMTPVQRVGVPQHHGATCIMDCLANICLYSLHFSAHWSSGRCPPPTQSGP